MTDAEKERVRKTYDYDENPLVYQIKPRGTFDIIESQKITKEDLQDKIMNQIPVNFTEPEIITMFMIN